MNTLLITSLLFLGSTAFAAKILCYPADTHPGEFFYPPDESQADHGTSCLIDCDCGNAYDTTRENYFRFHLSTWCRGGKCELGTFPAPNHQYAACPKGTKPFVFKAGSSGCLDIKNSRETCWIPEIGIERICTPREKAKEYVELFKGAL